MAATRQSIATRYRSDRDDGNATHPEVWLQANYPIDNSERPDGRLSAEQLEAAVSEDELRRELAWATAALRSRLDYLEEARGKS